jgi:citrate lyase subunit beta / citryl-CoA lyase
VIVPLPLTWLYVPADRPERVENALVSDAHAVIVDLEDGVAPEAKETARGNLAALLDRPRGKTVVVRVNGISTGLAERDLEAAGALAGVDAIALPKIEHPDEVARAVSLLPRERPLQCMIESPVGLEAAYEIACAPGVTGIVLGEVDLRSRTGALEEGLDWARGRLVNAAVAAGLPRPPQGVYTNIRDLDGLAASCRHGRALGHLGRQAIHPDQLPVIVSAYLPARDEVEQARATIERLEQSASASALESGAFVDAAMLGAARQVVEIWEAYGE